MSEMKKLVSVVIPAYNAEKTLTEAVDSVLCQTWPELEILIVDDCSRDGTWALVGRLAEKDRRIRVFRNEENRGVSYSRNFGARMAEGEYVALLDSDDLWAQDKLEKQMGLAEQHPEGSLFSTGSAFISPEGRHNGYIFSVPERVDRRTLLRQNVISCSSVLLRRETFLRHPMGNDVIHEDFALWLQLLREEPFAWGVNEPLLIYRVSPDSKSGNKIKAARMTFATYRAAGESWPSILWNGVFYTIRGIQKFRSIAAAWE